MHKPTFPPAEHSVLVDGWCFDVAAGPFAQRRHPRVDVAFVVTLPDPVLGVAPV